MVEMDLTYHIVDFEKRGFSRQEPSREAILGLISPLDQICLDLGGQPTREIQFDEGPYDGKRSAITRFIVGPCSVRNEAYLTHSIRETHIRYCQECCTDHMKLLVDEIIRRFTGYYGEAAMKQSTFSCQTQQV